MKYRCLQENYSETNYEINSIQMKGIVLFQITPNGGVKTNVAVQFEEVLRDRTRVQKLRQIRQQSSTIISNGFSTQTITEYAGDYDYRNCEEMALKWNQMEDLNSKFKD